MGRITRTAESVIGEGGKLLIPYFVAGDPDLVTTLQLMHTVVDKGADIIELGIPFSDPSSDGPVIQRSVERSLEGNTSLDDVLELVRQFREKNDNTPIVLMGYLNPIEIMGYRKFAVRASLVGIDGVLVVDMPPEESAELHTLLREAGVETIYLVSPTTSENRAKHITALCSGYLYYVSLKGVTGAVLSDYDSVKKNITRLRDLTGLPIVIGFGIKDRESVKAMGGLADGVVIGSALVNKIAKLPHASVQAQDDISECTNLIGVARKALNSNN